MLTSEFKELRLARLRLSRRGLWRPVALFGVAVAVYCASLFGTLAAPQWFEAPLVMISGLMIAILFVIGHDACHQSFTTLPRLNHLMGRIAFLPSLHAYSLWDREHNQRHHRFNNIRHLDYVWVPMSPQEYVEASRWRQLRYRISRHPIGLLFYYLIEIWPQRQIVARKRHLGTIEPIHIADTLLVWAFIAVAGWSVIVMGGWYGKGAVHILLIGLILPFVLFTMFISLATYLHHTHPSIHWYETVEQWEADHGEVKGTAHVTLPWHIEKLVLFITEHTAHHYAPGVPLYNLTAMQSEMARHGAFSWKVTSRNYKKVCRSCKLYDYETRNWLDFMGN